MNLVSENFRKIILITSIVLIVGPVSVRALILREGNIIIGTLFSIGFGLLISLGVLIIIQKLFFNKGTKTPLLPKQTEKNFKNRETIVKIILIIFIISIVFWGYLQITGKSISEYIPKIKNREEKYKECMESCRYPYRLNSTGCYNICVEKYK